MTAAATANARMAGASSVPERTSPLLAAAVQHRDRLDPAGQQQRPRAHRAAELVPGDGHRVRAAGREVDRQLAGRLHGVGVERDALLAGQRGELGDRLHHAHLVVRPHHGDQGHPVRVGGDGLGQYGGLEDPGLVHRQPVLLGVLVAGQPVHRVQHRVMLDRGGQHPRRRTAAGWPASTGCAAGPVQALHRQVVGFGAAAGKDHLAGPGAEHLGDLLPRLLDHAARPAPGVMQGRGIAQLAEFFGHRGQGLRQHRRRRRVVQVDHAVLGRPRARGRVVDVPHDGFQPSGRSGTWARRKTCSGASPSSPSAARPPRSAAAPPRTGHRPRRSRRARRSAPRGPC